MNTCKKHCRKSFRLSPSSILHKVTLLTKAIKNDKPLFAATLLLELSYATKRSAVKCFDRYRIFNTSIVFKTMQQENDNICVSADPAQGDSEMNEVLSSTLKVDDSTRAVAPVSDPQMSTLPVSLERIQRVSVVPSRKRVKRQSSTVKETTCSIVPPSNERKRKHHLNDIKLNKDAVHIEYEQKIDELQNAGPVFNPLAGIQFIWNDTTSEFVLNPDYIPRPPTPDFDYLSDSEIDMSNDWKHQH